MVVSLGLPAGSDRVSWPTCWQWACLLAYLLAVGVSLDLPAGSGRVSLTYLLAVGVSPGLPAGSGRVPYVGEASVPVPAHPGGVEAVHHLVGCTKGHETSVIILPPSLQYWQKRWQTCHLFSQNLISL